MTAHRRDGVGLIGPRILALIDDGSLQGLDVEEEELVLGDVILARHVVLVRLQLRPVTTDRTFRQRTSRRVLD